MPGPVLARMARTRTSAGDSSALTSDPAARRFFESAFVPFLAGNNGASDGLFRYNGKRVLKVEGDQTDAVYDLHDAPGGLLRGALEGLFRYDDKRVLKVEGEPTGPIQSFHDAPGGLLVGTKNGLFRYDGKRVLKAEGESTGPVQSFHDAQGGLLVGADNGLFLVVLQPLSTSKIVLVNSSRLKGVVPSQLGIPTRWA